MIVELVSVGTEILLGNIVNTNAAFLSEKCAALGLSVYYQVTVGDNPDRLGDTIKTALNRSDIVILTGGLGPTNDDITKKIVADIMGCPLVFDENVKKDILEYLMNSPYRDYIPENNYLQAYVPQGATVLKNSNGTAPGLIIEKNNKIVIMLPGPPSELKPLFNKQVEPFLKSRAECVIESKTLKLAEIAESQVDELINDILEKQTNPTVAPYAKTAEVHLRITAKAKSEKEAIDMIKPIEDELVRRFGNNIFTEDENDELEDTLVKLMDEKNIKLTTVESCTGGMIAARIVNVSGSSNVFEKGFVTYSDKAKNELVGVSLDTIDKFGVVSDETAKEMAMCGAKKTGANACLSVTGIAGPGGGTADTPVGTVYIGCYYEGDVKVRELHISGNRGNVRENATKRALNMLRLMILNKYK